MLLHTWWDYERCLESLRSAPVEPERSADVPGGVLGESSVGLKNRIRINAPLPADVKNHDDDLVYYILSIASIPQQRCSVTIHKLLTLFIMSILLLICVMTE